MNLLVGGYPLPARMVVALLAAFVATKAEPAVAQSAVEEQRLTIEAPEGIVLEGSHLGPDHAAPGILLLPQCSPIGEAWMGFARQLAAGGFQVLTFNYRGFGESGGSPWRWEGSLEAAFTHWRGHWQGDVEAAYRWLRSHPDVDTTFLAVGGASCGGFLSLLLAARQEPELRAVFLLSGLPDAAGLRFVEEASWLPMLALASEDDEPSASLTARLVSRSKNPGSRGITFRSAGHGAQLPENEPGLGRRVAEWLDAARAGPDWATLSPGGETSCAFGTPFEFWVREGDPSQLLVYLQGGGGCWSFESCHPEREIQFTSRIGPAAHAQRTDGIFDRSAEENPFRGHTAVFVPYCTGDFHLGARRVTHRPPPGEEGGPITVNHAGHRNVAAVLEYLTSRPVAPERITVIGGSAGAVASPFVAAEVQTLFPNAAVRQIGDGVAGLRLEAARSILALWGADSVLEARGAPVPRDGDAFAGLYRAAAARHPEIRFSQVATTEDWRVSEALEIFGDDPQNLPAHIAATYEELRAAGICFTGCALPGTVHTILWRSAFLTARVRDEPLPVVIKREVLDRPCGRGEAGTATPPAPETPGGCRDSCLSLRPPRGPPVREDLGEPVRDTLQGRTEGLADGVREEGNTQVRLDLHDEKRGSPGAYTLSAVPGSLL